ncbi:Ku protein [Streptomyces decoyicus]|uniref:Ku protein n=1 Tax=Streptomyces decoyicus TaxID=249567 RepID=UPI0033E25E16
MVVKLALQEGQGSRGASGTVFTVLVASPVWKVGAHGPGAQKPYALLVEALARTGRLAVGKVALRSRERLSVLRPPNGILVLHTLHWPEEIRDPGDLSSPAPTTDRELDLAELLMTEMAGVDVYGRPQVPRERSCAGRRSDGAWWSERRRP